MSISTLQNINYLISNTNSVTNKSAPQVKEDTDVTSFSEILSAACGNGTDVSGMFQSVFSNYDVQTKVGDCNVPWKCWDRNDFPIWEYFKKDTSADCLNNWRPTGTEPPQTDKYVQKGLSQIDYGQMVILMPESLQRKMEADPEFAKEVLKRVQKWKEDYDREDNAIAASLGYNPELNQLSKSYCIQLDEDGNVGDHTVTGGGLDDPHESSVTIISRDDHLIIRKTAHQKSKVTVSNTLTTMNPEINYESVAPILADIRFNKNPES